LESSKRFIRGSAGLEKSSPVLLLAENPEHGKSGKSGSMEKLKIMQKLS
jgi:hypothetical protein